MEHIKMHWGDKELIQSLLSIVVETYEEGAWIGISDREKLIFGKNSGKSKVMDIQPGTPNKPGGSADKVFKNP